MCVCIGCRYLQTQFSDTCVPLLPYWVSVHIPSHRIDVLRCDPCFHLFHSFTFHFAVNGLRMHSSHCLNLLFLFSHSLILFLLYSVHLHLTQSPAHFYYNGSCFLSLSFPFLFSLSLFSLRSLLAPSCATGEFWCFYTGCYPTMHCYISEQSQGFSEFNWKSVSQARWSIG